MKSLPPRLALTLAYATLALASCKHARVEANAVASEPAPLSVPVTRVQEIKVPRVLLLSGTLIGAERARVAAGTAGKVVATYVERGAVVRKGAVLARLDARTASAQAEEAAAQVESLKAARAQAQLDCERTQSMFDKGAISKADFDRASTQCATAKWSLSAAEARKAQITQALRDTQIRAPFAGMVVERTVSPGEYVRPDSPIATLVAVEDLRVELTVPEADLPLVRQGLEVELRLATGDTGKTYRGKIRYVGPAVREQTRDAVVEAVVENADHDLRPGMFVTGKVALGEQSLPGVPERAVKRDGTQHHVFAVVGGRVEDRLVQVGERRDGMVAVLNGLKPAEQIVAELTPGVRDGARVK